jgi:hypothetical protein
LNFTSHLQPTCPPNAAQHVRRTQVRRSAPHRARCRYAQETMYASHRPSKTQILIENPDNASCHCGAFTYTVTASPPLDDPKAEVMRPFLPQTPKIQQHHTDSSTECNCSICTRNGYLFIYTPNAAISFTKGEFSDLTEYRFGPKPKVAHYFCGTCGSSCVARSIGTFISTFVWGRGAMW